MIFKLQEGGVAPSSTLFQPIVWQAPATKGAQSNSGKSASSGGAKKTNYTDEILKLVNRDGLLNDSQVLASQASEVLERAKAGLEVTASDVLQVAQLSRMVERNKAMYDETAKKVSEENAGSDVAVSATGALYAWNKNSNQVEAVNVQTYQEDRDNYQVLTNADALHLREKGDMAFNTSILSDLKTVVGKESIVQYMQKSIAAFGTNKTEESDATIVGQQTAVEAGLAQMIPGNNQYKISTSKSAAHQGYSDADSLELATQYIWGTLPANMKNTMRATLSAEGGDPSDWGSLSKMMKVMISQNTDHTFKSERDISGGTSGKKSSGSGSGDDGTGDATHLEMLATGRGGDPTKEMIRRSDGKAAITMSARTYNVQDDTGKSIGRNNLEVVLNNTDAGALVNRNHIYFGDQRISGDDIHKIVWDGSSKWARVKLPTDSSGMAPDLEAADRFEKFVEWYAANEGTPLAQAQELAQEKYNLDIQYNASTGEWDFKPGRYKTFLMLHGSANQRNVDSFAEVTSLHSKAENNDQAWSIYQTYANYGKHSKDKNSKHVDSVESGWFGAGKQMYEAPIFMLMEDSKIAALSKSFKVPEERTHLGVQQSSSWTTK